MKENYAAAEQIILTYEGGYANNPKDPGGATMKGITQATYNAWLAQNGRPSAPVRNISDTDVSNIYEKNYWARMKCDEMPPGVDLCLFDAAVNSGVGAAAAWAQACVNLPTDGDFGTKTQEAVAAADPESFIRMFNSRRLATLQRLPTWSTFGKGWHARIANGQKIELAWAEGSDGPDPIQASTVGGTAKARPTDIPVSRTRVIVSNAVTAGGAVSTGVAQAGSAIAPASDVFTWIKYVLAGLTLAGAIASLVTYFFKTLDDAASNAQAMAKVDPDADANIPTKPISKPTVIAAAVGTAQGVAHA